MFVTTHLPRIETALAKILALLVLAGAGMTIGLQALASQRQAPADDSTAACLTLERPFVDPIPVFAVETSGSPHFSLEPNASTSYRLQRSSAHGF